MFSLRLEPKKTDEKLMELTLSIGFRLFFYGLGIGLLWFFLNDLKADFSAGPPIIITILLLVGSYYEAWKIDLTERKIIQKHGLFFLYRSKQISLDGVESVQLKSIAKGGKPIDAKTFDKKFSMGFRSMVITRLYLVMQDGSNHNIELADERHLKRMEELGKQIAAFCSKPFLMKEDY